MQELVTSDSEVIEKVSVPALIDNQTLSVIEKAQIDTQIATARTYPRSIKLAIDNILTLATLDEETAEECIYALPRSGKPIRGPSVRLAEIIAQCWGNNRVDARVVQIDRVNKVIVAEGTYMDLESNTATRSSVQRRISDKKGSLFNDDMITVTGNAAGSIARRNAILAGVPKGVWRKAVVAAELIIKGDAKTLVERRDQAVKAFAMFGLAPEQVFQIIGVKGLDDIALDDLATMRVIFAALKNKEQTVEELLRVNAPTRQRVGAADAKLAAPEQFAAIALKADKEPSNGDKVSAGAPAPANAAVANVGAPAQSPGPAVAAAPGGADLQPAGPKAAPQSAAGAKPAATQPAIVSAAADEAEAGDEGAQADLLDEAEIDDRDIIVNDIITAIRACNGNRAKVALVMAEVAGDYQRLDEPRKQKIDREAKAKTRKAA
jgi:hypothetical protein